MLRKPSSRRALASYIDSQERVDIKIVIILLMLNIFGIIMIYSASSYRCSLSPKFNYDSMYFARKQICYVAIGFIVMGIVRICDYNNLNILRFSKIPLLKKIKVLQNKKISMSWLIYLLSILMTCTLFTPLTVTTKGAARWIKLGPVSLQVAEVSKILIILWIGTRISRYTKNKSRWRIIWFIWIPAALSAGFLCYKSSNLSTAIILCGIIFGMTAIMTQFNKTHIVVFTSVVATVVLFINYIYTVVNSNAGFKNFRFKRIAAWLFPEKFSSSTSYQSLQALYAVASGGFTGKGLGNSVQKLSRIPEAQNDMIFAVICEELGILGAFILLGMFLYLIFQLFKIASRAETVFGRSIVTGIAIHISLQTIVNIFVVLMIFPNTGVSLPFISYGGSAVIFTMAEMGIVLSVDREHFKGKVTRKAKKIEEKELPEY